MSGSIFGALAFSYHEPREGFWGEKTVTLNFCEEDYVMSYYCAELCNTVTNMLFIWLGLKGIRDCLKYGHPAIFVVAFMGYMLVGAGSTFFHATLKYPMQLVDELSMIYTTCLMCYATFSYGRSRLFSLLLGVGLSGLSWYITARYYQTKDAQFHQDAYGVLTAVVVFSNMWIIEKTVRPALRRRQEERSPSSGVPPADAIVREMWIMVATGLTVFLGGFLIWNLDNVYCNTIRRWRHDIGLPWAVVLEGHAWWHLMTGLGGQADTMSKAYYYITWRVWIHRCLDGDEDKYRLSWPSVFSMPDVVAAADVPVHGNGKRAD
ncbi:alkaline dihydroceramidase [Truncatella angustata]|uniref:Alkaline dihydroceramidase n=1 Tax=Truncatella angustata TaxID=152316 RepID=A0A9P8UBT3_9PEZI|nr:alkaline dihydroceramidase [Truncatella angustata]KAH6646502.1 alkaline dihydroceramidase [Truncatella angustata]